MSRLLIITGVGKGFGRSLASALAEDFYVLGLSRNADDLTTLAAELSGVGVKFESIESDISEFDKTRAILNEKIAEIGLEVYGIINNAGVRCRKKFDELMFDDFLRISHTNLFGAINIVSTALPYMTCSDGGRIINISSILSESGMAELTAYATSKGGLDAFTRSLAVELAPRNITVNSILPGFCKTSYYEAFQKKTKLHQMTLDRTPMHRWGEQDEPLGLCKFLLSASAGYITGTSIPVDGGWLAG